MAFTDVLTIGGTVIDRVATDTRLISLTPHSRGACPTMVVSRRGLTLSAPGYPDPWWGQPVSWTLDSGDGSGPHLYFAGDVCRGPQYYDTATFGWVREYHFKGLRNRADRVPITDSNTGTDRVVFNDDDLNPNRLLSRLGRSIGQMVMEILQMPAIAAGLQAQGIGQYSSTGAGASGASTIAGGIVTALTLIEGGTGYTVAPSVYLNGGGGTGATATCTVTAGVVTAVTITAAGFGYTSEPTVVFSTLPAATVADLANLTIIPPVPCNFAGEKVIGTIDMQIRNYHRNHYTEILTDGMIRCLDQRTFTTVGITLNSATDPNWEMPRLTFDWDDCYQRVEVRGDELIEGETLSLAPLPGSSLADGGLSEALFAHDGLSVSQAKAAFRATDVNSSLLNPGQAVIGVSLVSGGASFSIQYGGYGYASAPGIVVSGGTGGSGAACTCTITGGVVTGLSGTAGSGYTAPPSAIVGAPGASQSDVGTCTVTDTLHVVLTSASAAMNYGADYYDNTITGHGGVLNLYCDTVIANYQQVVQRRVVANTAMTAGGTATFTLEEPLDSTLYTAYRLVSTTGGAASVYSLYEITRSDIANRVRPFFAYPTPYVGSSGLLAMLTSGPLGTVGLSLAGNGSAPYQEETVGVTVDPDAGTVRFNQPTCLIFGGGTTVTPADEVLAFLPVSKGTLTATWPADVAGVPQYSGTSNALGLTNTKIISFNDWRDSSNSANALLIAQEYLDSVQDIVIEGGMRYLGFFQQVMTPTFALEITGNGWTTGLETTPVPISGVTLDFFEGPQGATWCTTSVDLSNRRAEYSGQWRLAPNVVGVPLGLSGDAGVGSGSGSGSLLGGPGEAQQQAAENLQQNVSGVESALGAGGGPEGSGADLPAWMDGFSFDFDNEAAT